MSRTAKITLEIDICFDDDSYWLHDDEKGYEPATQWLLDNFDNEICKQIEKAEQLIEGLEA